MAEIDMSLVLKQFERMLTEMGHFRDEMAVQTAMLVRLDGTADGLRQEVRALHSYIARIEKRVHALEMPEAS